MDVTFIILIMLLVIIASLGWVITILGNDVKDRKQMYYEIHQINEELKKISSFIENK